VGHVGRLLNWSLHECGLTQALTVGVGGVHYASEGRYSLRSLRCDIEFRKEAACKQGMNSYCTE
jgi:hypothetical protein